MDEPRTIYYHGTLSDLDRKNIKVAKDRVYTGLVRLVRVTEGVEGPVLLAPNTPLPEWSGAWFLRAEPFWSDALDKALTRCLYGMDEQFMELEVAVEFMGGHNE